MDWTSGRRPTVPREEDKMSVSHVCSFLFDQGPISTRRQVTEGRGRSTTQPRDPNTYFILASTLLTLCNPLDAGETCRLFLGLKLYR